MVSLDTPTSHVVITSPHTSVGREEHSLDNEDEEDVIRLVSGDEEGYTEHAELSRDFLIGLAGQKADELEGVKEVTRADGAGDVATKRGVTMGRVSWNSPVGVVHMGIGREGVGVDKSRIGESKSRVGVAKSRIGVSKSRMGVA